MENEKKDVVETNQEQTTNKNWIERELKEVKENAFDGERLPSFKPEENKTKPSEPNEVIFKVRMVQGDWQIKSK